MDAVVEDVHTIDVSDDQKVMVVAVPNEMLAQLVQNNTDLTRCLTRLIDFMETNNKDNVKDAEEDEDVEVEEEEEEEEEYDDGGMGDDDIVVHRYCNRSHSHSKGGGVMDMIGTLINAFVIAAIFIWFLDLIGSFLGGGSGCMW